MKIYTKESGEDVILLFSKRNSFPRFSGGKEIPGYEYFLWLRKAGQPSEIIHHPSEAILLTGYQLDTAATEYLCQLGKAEASASSTTPARLS
jgi:hypothetical protein